MIEHIVYTGLGLSASLLLLFLGQYISGGNKKDEYAAEAVKVLGEKYSMLDKKMAMAEVTLGAINYSLQGFSALHNDQVKCAKDIDAAFVILREAISKIEILNDKGNYAMNEFTRLTKFIEAYDPKPFISESK